MLLALKYVPLRSKDGSSAEPLDHQLASQTSTAKEKVLNRRSRLHNSSQHSPEIFEKAGFDILRSGYTIFFGKLSESQLRIR